MTGQPAYTDAELDVAVEAYFKKHSGLARDCVSAALDAVVPGIVARAKAEALRERRRVIERWEGFGHGEFNIHLEESLPCSVCNLIADLRADEIEAGR